MGPLTQHEKDDIRAQVSRELSDTPYATLSLTALTNGTANFVYRGVLAQPIIRPDGRELKTVVIKHSTAFAAANKDLPLDLSRAVITLSPGGRFQEAAVLAALNHFRPETATAAKVPQLLHFIASPSIQVLEDFPSAVDLKGILVSPEASTRLTPAVSESIGRSLGVWLRSYHDWSFADRRGSLKDIGPNEPMRKLKLRFSYDLFVKVLQDEFPGSIEGPEHRSALERVQEMGQREFDKSPPVDGERADWGLIHGDFWSGNILLPRDSSAESQIFVVDWEFAQFGHRTYDIGQLIGDLYERRHFANAEGAVAAIDAFIRAYGQFDDDLAFRTAIHAGVHLVVWPSRGPPGRYPRERVSEVVRIGRDWIVNGEQGNKAYFANTPLAALFQTEVLETSLTPTYHTYLA